MLSRNMQEGALITREAYMALLTLKSVVEVAVERTRTAGFESIGFAVSPSRSGTLWRRSRVPLKLYSLQVLTVPYLTRGRRSRLLSHGIRPRILSKPDWIGGRALMVPGNGDPR